MASTSEGIRVQALKAIGYFLKHLAPKWVCMKSKMNCRILLTYFTKSSLSCLILFTNFYLNLILFLHIKNKGGVAVYCLSSMTLIWIFHLFLFIMGTHINWILDTLEIHFSWLDHLLYLYYKTAILTSCLSHNVFYMYN